MFGNRRIHSPILIKYNDIADYRYVEIKGILGAFTNSLIDPVSLPEGFQAFSLLGKPAFNRIISAEKRSGEATFICKTHEANDLGSGRGRLHPEDFVLQDNVPFVFQDFFGSHLSLECQVRLAEEKRLLQLSENEKGPVERENPSV